jgi:C2 domain
MHEFSVILEKYEVCKLICGSYATVSEFPQHKDPEKEEEDKQQNTQGTLTLSGGARGARCVDESTIIIYSCKDLALVINTAPSPYCVVLVNGVQVGKTEVVSNCTNPYWSEAWIHIHTGNISSASSTLEIQVWHTGSPLYLGGVTLTGQDLVKLAGSTTAYDNIFTLTSSSNIKAKQFVEGKIRIGIPGTLFSSQSQADSALEDKATEALRLLEAEENSKLNEFSSQIFHTINCNALIK